jgi:hypothetical protein
MFKNKKLASAFSRKISSAARLAIEDMAQGRAQQEPAITDRLIAYIQSEMRRSQKSPFTWNAMTLTDRGRNSQEKKYGADFVGSLEINLDGFHARKGFLAQAKKVEPNDSYSKSEFDKLVSQCKDMLRISPSSFVFLYSKYDGFSVVPAIGIVSSRSCNPHELTTKPVQKFFGEYFECFIGDPRIKVASIDTIDAIYERYHARTALHITIGSSDEEQEEMFGLNEF